MKHTKKTIVLAAFIPMALSACTATTPEKKEHEHHYDHSHPAWAWSEDHSKATVTLDCPDCDVDLSATVNSTVKTEPTPTCTEGSEKVYHAEADLDGEKFTNDASVSVDALGHQMTKHEAVAPTCEKDGNKEYWACSREEGTYYKDAEGKDKFASEEDVVVGKLGHAMVKHEAVEATCQQPGRKEYWTCEHEPGVLYKDEARTGVYASEEELVVIVSHNMTKHEAVAPKCTEAGRKEYYTCSYEEGVLYKDEEGNDKFASESELVVSATGHRFGEASYSWSGDKCTATKVCGDCETQETETVTGTFVQDTAATCTEPQKGHYVAEFTKEGFATQATATNSVTGTPATGHSYAAPTYSWSGDKCTASKVCSKCSDTVTETVTGTFVQDTAATCTEPQKGHYVAEFTKEGFATQATATNSATGSAALGHDMTHHAAVAPTCGTAGTVEYWTCSRDAGVYYGDANGATTLSSIEGEPATGLHTLGATSYNWANDGSTCTATATCSNCGFVKTEQGEISSEVTPGTAFVKGVTKYTATFATFESSVKEIKGEFETTTFHSPGSAIQLDGNITTGGEITSGSIYDALPEGFEHVYKITGKGANPSARMANFLMTPFKEVQFAIYCDGGGYFEPKLDGVAAWGSTPHASSWSILKFVNEGKGYFQYYDNGTWKNGKVDLDANLSDYTCKLGSAKDFYVTELVGIRNTSEYVSEFVKVLDNPRSSIQTTGGSTFNPYDPSIYIDGDIKSGAYTATLASKTGALNSLDLTNYSEVVFAIKASVASTWTAIKCGGVDVYSERGLGYHGYEYVRLVRQEDGKWSLKAGEGILKDLDISNLNEISLKNGSFEYTMSEVFAKPIVK